MQTKYYFEDFAPGSIWEIEGPIVTKEEIIEFASKFDPQYFHIDEAAAQRSPYGGLIASGWHTVSLCMRLMCDRYVLDSASLGSPGVNHVRWLHPVRPGDRLRLKTTVLEAKISRSKPDRGSLLNRWDVYNQDGTLVMTMEGWGIVGRRPRSP
jgi:acyl dehydratase